MKKKRLIIILIILLAIWFIMFITDYTLYKNNRNPIFCLTKATVYGEPNYSAFGIGYRINCYYLFNEKKMEFGTYSMLYDSLKYFPTDSTEPYF